MTVTMDIFDKIAQATVGQDMGPRKRADYIWDYWNQSDMGLTLRDFFLNVSDAEFKLMGMDIDA